MKQEGNKDRNLVRFDWAIKRLLRDKANFVILEGFLASLPQEERHAYYEHLRAMNSWNEQIEDAIDRGRFEGRAEGRIEGRNEEKLEIAKKC